MITSFSFWFWKPISIFFGTLALILLLFILVFLAVCVDAYILDPIRLYKLKRQWRLQTPDWRLREYNRMLKYGRLEHHPSAWMKSMIDQDKNAQQ
jgi:hypothetical protein